MSQVTDLAEKENQQPMTDQVITMEPKLGLCVFFECCSHLTNIKDLWFNCLSIFLQMLGCGEWILSSF